MKHNLILMTDSYKLSHWKQYPKGMAKVYSYMEARLGAKYPYTVFFGLQYYLLNYLQGIVVTQDDIEEADAFSKEHFGKLSVLKRIFWRSWRLCERFLISNEVY